MAANGQVREAGAAAGATVSHPQPICAFAGLACHS